MATNLEIDNELINEALKLGGHKTKRGVVEEALKECYAAGILGDNIWRHRIRGGLRL